MPQSCAHKIEIERSALHVQATCPIRRDHYQTEILPSAGLEMLSFSQNSPVLLEMSPSASRTGIFAPSACDLEGLPIIAPICRSSQRR
jgi:hypothetical protein